MRDELIPRPAGWRYGPRIRWGLTPSAAVWHKIARLGNATAVDPRGMRLSAVLIPIADTPQGPSVMLTKRSTQLRHHAGEISFPGGRVDPGENVIDAALREAHEEVGLEPGAVDIMGVAAEHRTVVSSSHIVPVVARIDRRSALTLNPAEVDDVFWVPIAALCEADRYRSEIWSRDGLVHVLHFFDVDELGDEVLWGATAHMMVGILDLLVA